MVAGRDHNYLKKYQRMLKSGVPLQAVEQTARMDGLDPAAVTLALAAAEVEDANPECERSTTTTTLPTTTIDDRDRRFLNKYERMLKSGVPLGAVEQTARLDGLDPSYLLDGATISTRPVIKRLPPSPDRKEALLKKYKKMIKSGVPRKAVESVVKREWGEEADEIIKSHLVFQPEGPTEEELPPKLFWSSEKGMVEFPLSVIGKESHLALLIRKMVLTVKRARVVHGEDKKEGTLKVENRDLYNALGGLRGVQVSRDLYNSTCEPYQKMNGQEVCSKRKPFLELLSGLGIRAPTRRRDVVDIQGLDQLVKHIEATNQKELEAIQECLNEGMYDFDSLAELYKPGTRVLAKSVFASGVDMICEVFWNRYEQGKTLMGVTRKFKVCFQFMVAVGKHFTICEFVHGMEHFEGRRSIQTALDFVPLFAIKAKDKLQEMHRERGKVYAKCATAATFIAYDKGSFYAKTSGSSGARQNAGALNTGGRVMIDTQGSYDAGQSLGIASNDLMITGIQYKYKEYMLHMRKVQQEAKGGMSQANDDDMILFDEVPDDYLEMTWPAVVGFSFTSKAWGEVIVDGLSDIHFDESVFDNLVLPVARKRMVKALVRHSSDSFQDIVQGKGEGSVFLLYGPPGCGKTLTAEAISEMLHRPLYSVSLGQVGVTPTELETRLGEILDLCRRWDALILLDEADIFLEKRSTSGSLERNAMVSVMLRLVEYFKGVLFLTSNRVDALDPAFKTRITLGLRYESLGLDARKQVWTNLLSASGYKEVIADPTIIDVGELAKHQLNGREIKNAIRLAMSLAQEDGEPLSQKLLHETIDTLNDFNEKMNSAEAY